LHRHADPTGARNLPISVRAANLPSMQPQSPIERRSDRRDRRRAEPAAWPAPLERRSGERRRLPRSRWQQWPSLLASAVLGVVVAVAMQSLVEATPTRTGTWAAGLPGRLPPRSVPVQAPRFTASEAEALRDEAERLTPAAVALDEQAALRWWPLRGELEAAAADPATLADVRTELHATLEALARVGL